MSPKKVDRAKLQAQHDKIDEAFATIRAVLQRPPSTPAWRQLLANVTYCMKKEPGEYDEPIKRFESEFLPYITSALASWPDDLKLVPLDELEYSGDLGRIVLVRKPEHEQSKKMLKQDVKLFAHAPSLVGVYMDGNRKYLFEHIEAYCGALSKPLEYVHFEAKMASSHDSLNQGKYRDEAMQNTVNWLIERHGATLIGLGLDISIWTAPTKKQVDALWTPLIAHIEQLPNLRHLFIGQARGSEDWGKVILDNPAFDQLDTIAECNMDYRLPVDALLDREASKHIKRLRMYDRSDEIYKRIITADTMINLEIAELESTSNPYVSDGWGTATADHWEYERHKLIKGGSKVVRHPQLNKTDLELYNNSVEEIRDIMLDEDKNLVPSERVQKISLKALDKTLFKAIFTQAHTAYPNLRELTLYESFTPSDYVKIQKLGEALLDKLERLWLSTHLTKKYVSYPDQKARFDELMKPWFELFMDESMHPKLRYWAWEIYRREGPTTVPFIKKRLSKLGVPYTSSMKADELEALLADAMPEAIKAGLPR